MPYSNYSAQKESSESLLHNVDDIPASKEWHLQKRGQLAWLLCVLAGLLGMSVVLNAKFLYYEWQRADSTAICRQTNSNLQYEVSKQFEDENDYLYDTPLAAALWRNMSLQGLTVALSTETVQRLNLEPSQPFPWDEDRHLYYVKSIHQLHCLKLLRHALVGFFNSGTTELEKNHLLHCVEAFRQDVMCEADDTFLPLNPGSHLGAGKHMQCRDWDEMRQWALQDDFDSCWDIEDDYRPLAHGLERFSHCKPTSRYRGIQEQYFQLHGHKPTFKDEELENS